MRTYTGLIFNKITQPKADALTLAEDTVIDHCIFDFRSIPLSEQDEIVSGVNGPKVTIRNSLFLGGIKALLAGNGDHLIESVRWRIERHNDELALGREPTEPLEPLLQYVQALRDVPQQEGFPETISWPVLSE